MLESKKILLFGSSGLLGCNFLQFSYKKKIKVVANINRNKLKNFKNLHSKVIIQVGNKNKIIDYLRHNKFEAVISFIGMTSIEESETNKKKADLINFFLNKNIADACYETEHNFVFISTDHLFSGKKKSYSESSTTYPLNYYAKTKLFAENYIKKKNKKFLIIRTNFLAKNLSNTNNGKKSFSDHLIFNLKKNRKISLWNDIYFNPVDVQFLFGIILKLLKKNKKGIFNVSSNKEISKYSLGVKLARALNLNHRNINKNKLDENFFVKRPRNMVLNNKKVRLALKIKKNKFDINYQIKLLLKSYIN